MKIILTDHSKQRRPHLKIESDKFLKSWINYFEKQLYLKDKKDGIYKISSGGSAAVIRKNKDNLILITFRGFKDFENRKDLRINLKHQKDRVYRKDDSGRVRVCGDIEWAELTSIVVLRPRIFEIYDLPFESSMISFKKTEDLKENFYFENGKWILKDYPKKTNVNSVFRKNYKGRLVRCGELIDKKLYLDYSLMNKYKIPVYNVNKEENSKFIHYENDMWMLNEFERIKSLH